MRKKRDAARRERENLSKERCDAVRAGQARLAWAVAHFLGDRRETDDLIDFPKIFCSLLTAGLWLDRRLFPTLYCKSIMGHTGISGLRGAGLVVALAAVASACDSGGGGAGSNQTPAFNSTVLSIALAGGKRGCVCGGRLQHLQRDAGE